MLKRRDLVRTGPLLLPVLALLLAVRRGGKTAARAKDKPPAGRRV